MISKMTRIDETFPLKTAVNGVTPDLLRVAVERDYFGIISKVIVSETELQNAMWWMKCYDPASHGAVTLHDEARGH